VVKTAIRPEVNVYQEEVGGLDSGNGTIPEVIDRVAVFLGHALRGPYVRWLDDKDISMWALRQWYAGGLVSFTEAIIIKYGDDDGPWPPLAHMW